MALPAHQGIVVTAVTINRHLSVHPTADLIAPSDIALVIYINDTPLSAIVNCSCQTF